MSFFIQDITEPSLKNIAVTILKKIEEKRLYAAHCGEKEVAFIKADIEIFQSQLETLSKAQKVINCHQRG